MKIIRVKNTTTDKQLTSNRQATDKQPTTNKNVKNVRMKRMKKK